MNITMPVPHHSSFFTGRMPFLPPNHQRQSTEGTSTEGKARQKQANILLDVTLAAKTLNRSLYNIRVSP